MNFHAKNSPNYWVFGQKIPLWISVFEAREWRRKSPATLSTWLAIWLRLFYNDSFTLLNIGWEDCCCYAEESWPFIGVTNRLGLSENWPVRPLTHWWKLAGKKSPKITTSERAKRAFLLFAIFLIDRLALKNETFHLIFNHCDISKPILALVYCYVSPSYDSFYPDA